CQAEDGIRAFHVTGVQTCALPIYFDAMFAIADATLGLPAADARAWFALNPTLRTPFLERGDLRTTAALLVLEEAALRREQAQAKIGRASGRERVDMAEGGEDVEPA